MKNEQIKNKNGKAVHSLAALDEFKVLFGVDDREDDFSTFLLVSATYHIEQYCMRRLLYKKITQGFEAGTGNCFQLLDYPVRGVCKVQCEARLPFGFYSLVAPQYYHVSPSLSEFENYPYHLHLHPDCKYYGTRKIAKVEYYAGYKTSEVPPDLKSACLELAAWNYQRHHEKKIGIEGGKDDFLAASMPENVRALLAGYRRVTI